MQRTSTKKNWDEFWNRKQHVEEVYSNVERIITNLRRVTDLNGKRILEVGAGTARDSFKLVNEGAEVFVLDYSSVALEIVNHLNQQSDANIHPILADAFRIPAADSTFDIVFHQGLLEHFKDPMPLLRENVRVLKEGGYLLVDVPQRYHIYTIIKHILIFLNKWFAGWETEFSINDLQDLAERSGVKVVYRYGSWMRPSLFYRIMREILLKINIKLPLYPRGIPGIRKIRNSLRKRFIHSNWALYTFLDIGIIGQKDASDGK
ncbi:methyltransferase domain-containing protein [candidate division KSB1 bacterium]|nr:methyltransferase domain-containing protein [candidate division KSB1 bacterium]